MTIKHEEETSITELGDNKVMKQAVDNAFISAFINNEVKPNFVYDGILYLIRLICGVCGFVSYFKYKDYFAGKEMILLLSVVYYVLCAIDYAYNYFFIKNSFIIGSLPAGSKYSDAKEFRATSECNFGDYDYKLTISAEVKGKPVSYTFVKPVGSYFKDTGVLVSKVIEDDCAIIMETFRGMLHDAAVKKEN